MRIILVMTLLLSVSALGFSQSDTSNRELLIGFGASQNLIKDQNFAPFKLQGSGTGLNLGYQKRGTNNRLLFLKFYTFSASIQSDFSDFNETKEIQQNLQLGYLTPLKTSSEQLKFYLGGSLNTHIDFIEYENDGDTEALSYFNLHTINFNTRISFEPSSKNRFLFDIDLPLFGMMVRPPYAGWDQNFNITSTFELLYKGSLAAIGQFKAWNIQLAYQYDIAPKFTLQFQATHNYKTINQDKAVAVTSFHFSTSLNYKF